MHPSYWAIWPVSSSNGWLWGSPLSSVMATESRHLGALGIVRTVLLGHSSVNHWLAQTCVLPAGVVALVAWIGEYSAERCTWKCSSLLTQSASPPPRPRAAMKSSVTKKNAKKEFGNGLIVEIHFLLFATTKLATVKRSNTESCIW